VTSFKKRKGGGVSLPGGTGKNLKSRCTPKKSRRTNFRRREEENCHLKGREQRKENANPFLQKKRPAAAGKKGTRRATSPFCRKEENNPAEWKKEKGSRSSSVFHRKGKEFPNTEKKK